MDTSSTIRVLAIEDEETQRKYLNFIFSNCPNYIAKVISNVDYSPGCVKEFSPDCIILDHVMSPKDGITILQEIRDTYSETVPVIFCTGSEDRKVIELFFQSSASDYLSKPVEKNVLFSRINANVSKEELRKFKDEYLNTSSLDYAHHRYARQLKIIYSTIEECRFKLELLNNGLDSTIVTGVLSNLSFIRALIASECLKNLSRG